MKGSTLKLAMLASLCLSAVCGCGGGQPVKTEAYVTMDGQPVEGATVAFIPEDSKVGRPATGLTGPGGTAPMTTNNYGDGVVPGVYKVTVSKTEAKGPAVAVTKSDPMEAMKANYGGFVKETVKKGAVKAAVGKQKDIPDTYSDHTKTPFKFTVPVPGGKAELPIQKGKT